MYISHMLGNAIFLAWYGMIFDIIGLLLQVFCSLLGLHSSLHFGWSITLSLPAAVQRQTDILRREREGTMSARHHNNGCGLLWQSKNLVTAISSWGKSSEKKGLRKSQKNFGETRVKFFTGDPGSFSPLVNKPVWGHLVLRPYPLLYGNVWCWF